MNIKIYPVFIFLSLCLNLPAQQWEWARQSFSTTASQNSKKITGDNAGNVFVLGYQKGQAHFGTALVDTGYFVIKYNEQGSVLWARNISYSPSYIKADLMGNLFLMGNFTGTMVTDNGILVSNGNKDIFLIKLNGQGNEIWAHSYGWTMYDFSIGLVVDQFGDAYFSGYADNDTLVFNNYTKVDTASFGKFFLAKVNGHGSTEWVTRGMQTTDSSYYYSSQDLAINKNNVFVVVRKVARKDQYPTDFNIAKFDFNGNLKQEQFYSHSFLHYIYDFEVDDHSNFFIRHDAGYHTGAGYLFKYDSLLNGKWSFNCGEQYGCFGFGNPKVDKDGNLYLQGTIVYDTSSNYCDNNTFTLAGTTYSSKGGIDLLEAKFNPSGTCVWMKAASGEGNETGTDHFITKAGECYITGDFNFPAYGASYPVNYPVYFDQHSTTNNGNYRQIFTAKIDSTQNLVALKEYSKQTDLTIYPNPSSGVFNFTLNEASAISVINIIGTEIYSQPANEKTNTIDLRGNPKGIYFLRITNSSGTFLRKLVVE